MPLGLLGLQHRSLIWTSARAPQISAKRSPAAVLGRNLACLTKGIAFACALWNPFICLSDKRIGFERITLAEKTRHPLTFLLELVTCCMSVLIYRCQFGFVDVLSLRFGCAVFLQTLIPTMRCFMFFKTFTLNKPTPMLRAPAFSPWPRNPHCVQRRCVQSSHWSCLCAWQPSDIKRLNELLHTKSDLRIIKRASLGEFHIFG